ncbi:class I SAM-dependent RNA methyltransferase [Leptospira wolffii]|uniref:class I SAM-dependent RNA methyltransferase n=1 Tax=Leptospira wolffii TaxID=409998 RepID=UPI0003465648|nr:class I SAM-dependent RNA methyltransferase [Leptospira wolffii]
MGTEKNRARRSRIPERKISRSREISGLRLEKWANLGVCISHSEEKTIFVKGGIPGETVRIRVDKENSKLIWGTVLDIQVRSNSRIDSDCSSFPECGGCSYRQIDYEEEIRVKKELLKDSFVGFAKFRSEELPEISVISGPSIGYRNTAQIKSGISSGKKVPGFYKEHSNSLVPIPDSGCKNLPSEMNDFIRKNFSNTIGKARREDWKLRFSSGKISEYKKEEVKIGPYLSERIEWRIPANGFTQVNRFLIEEWMLKIRSWIPDSKPSLLEFYSGAGLISLAIAPKLKSLIGYELSDESVRYAGENAKLAGYSHLSFHSKDLLSLNSTDLSSKGIEMAVLNPPRAGASPSLLEFLSKARFSRIVYSSCNHVTLARDLRVLQDSGYKIREIVLTDFFPRTQHFEVLTLLES